eukprot:m.164126 g.164126  ORF g.164126 m.164126 type:complete len:305 (-) comp10312_c0_seq5:82-996(-)
MATRQMPAMRMARALARRLDSVGNVTLSHARAVRRVMAGGYLSHSGRSILRRWRGGLSVCNLWPSPSACNAAHIPGSNGFASNREFAMHIIHKATTAERQRFLDDFYDSQDATALPSSAPAASAAENEVVASPSSSPLPSTDFGSAARTHVSDLVSPEPVSATVPLTPSPPLPSPPTPSPRPPPKWCGWDMSQFPPRGTNRPRVTFSWLLCPLFCDALEMDDALAVFTFVRPVWWSELVDEYRAVFAREGITRASLTAQRAFDRKFHLTAEFQEHLTALSRKGQATLEHYGAMLVPRAYASFHD